MRSKFKVSIVLAAAAVASFYLYANQSCSCHETPIALVLSPFEGVAWVENYVQHYPEILWLADDQVRKTEEGTATTNALYSEVLFGKRFIEFDRTMMTLRCLRLVLDGSDTAYEQFTAAQPADVKLSRDSFAAFHAEGFTLLHSAWHGLSSQQMAQAMETALILGDIGKSEKARAQFANYNIKAPDHDDFHEAAMEVLRHNPNLSPSFARLSPEAKELLLKTANLAHYGHITHLEGTASMFSKLKTTNIAAEDALALQFSLFVHTCDVAGALGHVDRYSSLMYIEPTHRAITAMKTAVAVLSDPEKSEQNAYDAYLATRASWLGLGSSSRIDRVLARIGAMTRLLTPEEGAWIQQAIHQLSPADQQMIVEQFDVQKQDALARTPTYIPALLINLMNNVNLAASREERLKKAITLGLPMVAKVLQKQSLQMANSDIPLNFNKAAGLAKNDPSALVGEFMVEPDGIVVVAQH
jgi:hypothetical protein